MDDVASNNPAIKRTAPPASRLMVLFFSDIVGSTDLKARIGTVEYSSALRQHDRVFHEIIETTPGSRILKDTGDGFFASFGTASDAVRAALRFQHELARTNGPIAVRVGVHVGEVAELDHDSSGLPKIVGLAADFAARLMSIALGGQILLTRFAFNEARQFVLEHPRTADHTPHLVWIAHGQYVLKGYDEAIELFEVGAEGIAPLRPPPDGPAARRSIRPGDEVTLGWRPAAGLEIPRRNNWIIKEKLGEGGFGEVWLAENTNTRAESVFKFCFEPERLRGLKREVVLFRLLKDAVGDRQDIGRILDYQFEQPPYFVETEHVPSGNLLNWAERQGGIDKVDLPTRVEIVAAVAEALSIAHSVGVLHKDIKPSNILVATGPAGRPAPKLTDFGIGILTDRTQLERRNIVVTDFTQTAAAANESSRTGTRMYSPPESLTDKPFTVQGDLYALGVLLYQMVIADLYRPLAPGWERDVDDEMLREDIAACVEGDPQRRLGSASELARRLRALSQRRAQVVRERAEAALAARRQRLIRVTSVVAVLAALLAGLMGLLLQQRSRRLAAETDRAQLMQESLRAAELSRDNIQRERDKAVAVTNFLRDMIGSVDPAHANKQDITVREVLDRAAGKIEEGVKDQPEVEGAVRGAIGRTYLVLGLYPASGKQLERAVQLFRQAKAMDQPLAIKALNDLGALMLYTAQYESAEKAMLETLQLREQTFGSETAETGDSLYNLCLLYGQWRKFDLCEQYGKRALALRERLFGSDSASVAAVIQYLALMYNDSGRFDMAIPLFDRSLDVRIRTLGADHVEVGNSYANLGLCYMNLGDLDKAEEHYQKAIAIFDKRLPANHPNVAIVMANMATVYARRQNWDAADRAALRALAIQEEALGPEHPDLLQPLSLVAMIRYARKDYEAAEPMYRRVVRLAEQRFGENDPQTLIQRRTLAFVLRDGGKYDEATPMFDDIARRYDQIGDKREAVQTRVGQVEGLIWAGRCEAAEPLARQNLDAADALAQPEARQKLVTDSLELLAQLYEKWNKPDEASSYRARLAATSQPAAPTSQPTTRP